MNMGTVYQLRKAAGTYWLLDMSQTGPAYTRPVPLNESGAKIWQMLENGKSPEQMAEIFAGDYDITYEEAVSDIRQFLKQLERQGIRWNGSIVDRRQQ